MTSPNESIMVSFPFVEGENVAYENLHVIADSDGHYLIDNSPFYAYDISFGDIVNATEMNGRLVFDSIYARGGHSTYRVKLSLGCSHDYFLKHWSELKKLGCSFEGTSTDGFRLYSIDVPPVADIRCIYRYLQNKEEGGVWQFEEAHYCPPEHRPRTQ